MLYNNIPNSVVTNAFNTNSFFFLFKIAAQMKIAIKHVLVSDREKDGVKKSRYSTCFLLGSGVIGCLER